MLSRKSFTGTILALAAIALAACGGNTEDLGEAKDSGVQGVPVPEAAEAREDLDGAWSIDADSATVITWYEDELPVGESYEGLEFCEVYEDDAMTSWTWWEEAPQGHGGTPWLMVSVFHEEANISINYDEEDPSECAVT